MVNCSEGGRCDNCSVLVGGGSTPTPLLLYAVVHCYVVFTFGTACNLVAVWCVLTCNKTRPPVKLILTSMFVTTLLMCLLVMPFGAEMALSELWCDPSRVSLPAIIIFSQLYTILAEMELLYITALAILRALAVWSAHRRALERRAAVAIIVGVFLYSVLTTVGLLIPLLFKLVTEGTAMAVGIVYSFLNFVLPVLLVIACYCSMMLAVRRNKLRLETSQHNARGRRVVDEATRAMIAVFISNLLLSLPHSVFHLFWDRSFTTYIIIHMLFFLHFMLDPVAFVWFNSNHRKRVRDKIRSGLDKVRCWSSTVATPSVLTTSTATPATSTDDAT